MEKKEKLSCDEFCKQIRSHSEQKYKQDRALLKDYVLYNKMFTNYVEGRPIKVAKAEMLAPYFKMTLSSFKLALKSMNKSGIYVKAVKRFDGYYIEFY